MTDALTPYLVKHHRRTRGLSLEELSQAAEVRESCLRLYEANRYDLGSYALQRLAAALGETETSEEAANA